MHQAHTSDADFFGVSLKLPNETDTKHMCRFKSVQKYEFFPFQKVDISTLLKSTYGNSNATLYFTT